MAEHVDSLLLNKIVDSLGSSDVESISSTCSFLETVVIYDFPTESFLQQRDLLVCLLRLCQDENAEISNRASSCFESICLRILSIVKRKEKPFSMSISKLISDKNSTRDPGDGAEENIFTLSNLAFMVIKACHQMILKSEKPFDHILKLLNVAAGLAQGSQSPTENLEFYQTLSSISSALRVSPRQHFATFLLLMVNCMEWCPSSSLSGEVVFEMYNGLLDASITHYHPEILEKSLDILKENNPLYEKYQEISNLYLAFNNLGKFLKNSDQEYDLLPVIELIKLDDRLTESLLPWIFKHLREFGGKPAITMTLLLLSQQEPILGQIYQLLAELASPLKSIKIGPHIGDLFVDEAVVRAIGSGMCSDSMTIAPVAERILCLILKGRIWMNSVQWKTLVGAIIPKLMMDIEPRMHDFKMLNPLLWDLINQSLLMPDNTEESFSPLDLNFVLRLLIRNLSRKAVVRDKSSLSLISVMCLQPQAHQLRPRISAIDPMSLSETFQGDAPLQLESTAKFGVPTLMETLEALKNSDLINARTHLMKLAIILEDNDLHPNFIENGGKDLLCNFLHKSLLVADAEPCLLVMSSIVRAMLFVSHANPSVRQELASNNSVLLNLLRAAMMTKDDVISRRTSITLLQLLSEVKNSPPPRMEYQEQINTDGWTEMWSKAVVRWSAKFIFNAELSTPPLIQSVPSFLQLTPAEIELGMSANDCGLAEKALNLISNANDHHDVNQALSLLREVLQRTKILPEVFNLDWGTCLETFFTVLPESSKDEEVLSSILEMLLLALRQLESLDDVEEYFIFEWLHSIMANENHVFWTLFQDRVQHFNKPEIGNDRLLHFLIRFVLGTVRLVGSHANPGSLNHILELLSNIFQDDNQSQAYQLNSLKLILDCTVHTTAVVLERQPTTISQTVLSNLLKFASATLVSFSSKNHSNKGRSVVQSCAQLINMLIVLSQSCSSGCVPLPTEEWLVDLLQHPDPVVKVAGIDTCTLISRNVHISDEVADIALSILFDAEENCTVLERACLLLSQHPARMTNQAVYQVVYLASSTRIRLNQSLLHAILQLLINCTHIQSSINDLRAIMNDLLPVLPSILNDKEAEPNVKAGVLCLLYRLALLESKVAIWLLGQFECMATAIDSLQSDEENLVGEAALFITFLLQTEDDQTNKVFQVVLQSLPELWNLFSFLIDRTLASPVVRRVLLFFQSVLTAAIKAERSLDLDPVNVENFCKWILPSLPAKLDNSVRHSVLQVLGLLLLSCPTPTEDSIKITTEFIYREFHLSSSHCSDKYLSVLIQLAHNFVIKHTGAEQELLQRGILTPLIEIWKTRSSRETMGDVLLSMVNFEKLLVGTEKQKEVRVLLKLMMEYLEEKEAVVARQSTPVAEEDWKMIESIHELLLASVSSLECRRILAKYKYWNSLAQTWHPVYLKRIINRQQHASLIALINLRACLLSAMTVNSEPSLPDLMDCKVAQTLVDMVSHAYGAQKHALSILRNMAFHNAYKSYLLSAHNVVPLFVHLFTGHQTNGDSTQSIMAITALISLASNNQRVKSEIRSLTEAWFQRNPIVVSDETSQFQHFCLNLQKLVDL